jgi:ABC-type sugar transport system ATPase subunit
VALARAMVRVPALCLLDEPLASVDAELRLRMRGEIRAVQRSLGVPMVHVTHDQFEAMAMGDRVAVMDGGRVLQCDRPEVLYSQPATTAVARIVGPLPMNLLPVADGIVVGVRPERVRVCREEDGGRVGSVVSVEPAGEECLVRVLVDEELLARLPWTAAPKVGERVSVAWRPEDEHHFDAASGRRR